MIYLYVLPQGEFSYNLKSFKTHHDNLKPKNSDRRAACSGTYLETLKLIFKVLEIPNAIAAIC